MSLSTATIKILINIQPFREAMQRAVKAANRIMHVFTSDPVLRQLAREHVAKELMAPIAAEQRAEALLWLDQHVTQIYADLGIDREGATS